MAGTSGNSFSGSYRVHYTRRFVHVDVPLAARTDSTRFRWWQPTHGGARADQWALDHVHVGQYHGMQQGHDDFTVRSTNTNSVSCCV